MTRIHTRVRKRAYGSSSPCKANVQHIKARHCLHYAIIQDWGHEYVTLIGDGYVVIQIIYEQIGGQNLDIRLQNDSFTRNIMAELDISCVETR